MKFCDGNSSALKKKKLIPVLSLITMCLEEEPFYLMKTPVIANPPKVTAL